MRICVPIWYDCFISLPCFWLANHVLTAGCRGIVLLFVISTWFHSGLHKVTTVMGKQIFVWFIIVVVVDPAFAIFVLLFSKIALCALLLSRNFKLQLSFVLH